MRDHSIILIVFTIMRITILFGIVLCTTFLALVITPTMVLNFTLIQVEKAREKTRELLSEVDINLVSC